MRDNKWRITKVIAKNIALVAVSEVSSRRYYNKFRNKEIVLIPPGQYSVKFSPGQVSPWGKWKAESNGDAWAESIKLISPTGSNNLPHSSLS